MRFRSRVRGFSLIELALGLVIVATMLSALLVPLATQVDQRRTAETEKLLAEARDALIGFAIAQGRLPCPAVYVDNTSRGVEKFGDVANDDINGICKQYRGYLPATTLGLSPVDRAGYMTDGYGGDTNRIRYAVTSADGPTAGKKLFTATGEMKAGWVLNLLVPAGFWLTICNENSDSNTECSTGGVSQPSKTLAAGNVIAVVWSAGNHPTGRSDDENENLDGTPANRIFVSRTRSDLAGSEFDDLLLWISPNILINRMVVAGRLP